jgi:hypothetical protein
MQALRWQLDRICNQEGANFEIHLLKCSGRSLNLHEQIIHELFSDNVINGNKSVTFGAK